MIPNLTIATSFAPASPVATPRKHGRDRGEPRGCEPSVRSVSLLAHSSKTHPHPPSTPSTPRWTPSTIRPILRTPDQATAASRLDPGTSTRTVPSFRSTATGDSVTRQPPTSRRTLPSTATSTTQLGTLCLSHPTGSCMDMELQHIKM